MNQLADDSGPATSGADVLDEVQQLIASLESHPDPTVGAQVTALLEGIDAIHRTALAKLMGAIKEMAGDAFINRLTGDPAIRLLLMSYELVAVDRRLLTEEALDAVRGHLHAGGVDVELIDVVGGAVYVRLHGVRESGVPLESVTHDIEAALQQGLLGFQELIVGDRVAASSAFVQLGGVRRAQRPVYRRALAASQLPEATMQPVEIDGQAILLARVDGQVYAVANRCGESPLPLHFGRLERHAVHCSWHGCQYDVRSGTRLDVTAAPRESTGTATERDGGRLAVFPVREQDGEVMVAVGVEPVPGP